MKRRLGRLSILEGVIDSPEATEIFRQLGFVPWDCEYIDGDEGPDRFEMCGASPMFDEIEDLGVAPFYEMKTIATKQGFKVAVRRLLPPLNPVVAGINQAIDA